MILATVLACLACVTGAGRSATSNNTPMCTVLKGTNTKNDQLIVPGGRDLVPFSTAKGFRRGWHIRPRKCARIAPFHLQALPWRARSNPPRGILYSETQKSAANDRAASHCLSFGCEYGKQNGLYRLTALLTRTSRAPLPARGLSAWVYGLHFDEQKCYKWADCCTMMDCNMHGSWMFSDLNYSSTFLRSCSILLKSGRKPSFT